MDGILLAVIVIGGTGLLIGALLGIIGFFIAGPLLHIMNNDDELSELYLKIYFNRYTFFLYQLI